MLFLPIQNKPPLASDTCDLSKLRYLEVAWIVYWGWVDKVSHKCSCGLKEAREIVHAHGVVPRRHKNDFRKNIFWTTHDYLCEFMMQFGGWQWQLYDTTRLVKQDQRRGTAHHWFDAYKMLSKNGLPSLDNFVSLLSYGVRANLVDYLVVAERWSDIDELILDPIYGAECEAVIENKKFTDNYRESEEKRKALLPSNIKAISDMIGVMWPSIYNVIYPTICQYHNVPNCLCITADGSMLFRLQVLDPDTCTQFELAELMRPWWREGHYDFPFPDFDLAVGDRFDYTKFLEVINKGVEIVLARNNCNQF